MIFWNHGQQSLPTEDGAGIHASKVRPPRMLSVVAVCSELTSETDPQHDPSVSRLQHKAGHIISL